MAATGELAGGGRLCERQRLRTSCGLLSSGRLRLRTFGWELTSSCGSNAYNSTLPRMVAMGTRIAPRPPHRSRRALLTDGALPRVLTSKRWHGSGCNVVIGGKKQETSRMNFSQLRRAVWLRRLAFRPRSCSNQRSGGFASGSAR